MSQNEKAARLAALKARLARYVQVGDEINAELRALGLDVLVCDAVKRSAGKQEAIGGGVGFQPRAKLLYGALERVSA